MLGTADDPIRVLRVIARLNVGGPSLHVSYLSEGLAERGYRTTLAAGTISKGEGSMAFIAQERGIEIESVTGLQRDVAPFKDASAVKCLRAVGAIKPANLNYRVAHAIQHAARGSGYRTQIHFQVFIRVALSIGRSWCRSSILQRGTGRSVYYRLSIRLGSLSNSR